MCLRSWARTVLHRDRQRSSEVRGLIAEEGQSVYGRSRSGSSELVHLEFQIRIGSAAVVDLAANLVLLLSNPCPVVPADPCCDLLAVPAVVLCPNGGAVADVK